MDAVIVTHNSEREIAGLVECRDLRANFDEIIVVDSNSADRTCAVARAAGMSVIERDENVGFGAAANVGVRNTRGPYFALLNPDIRFTLADGATALADHFVDPRVALVGPRLMLPSGLAQDSARAVPSPMNLLRRRLTRGQDGVVTSDTACDVPWVVGACVLVRRAAFDAVGGFDPRYFLYFEDVDLCVRLWGQGWVVRFEPRVVVDHEHQAASRRWPWSSATRHHIRSATRFFLTHPRYVAPRRKHLARPLLGRDVLNSSSNSPAG